MESGGMTTLGRYEIFDKLGTGSMGTVYRAQDTVLEREVALKTIRTEGDIHPELRERFYREARACARLQHPSIVVVHDLGEIERVAYIAMELLDGADFRKLIEQRVEIPLATKLEVMAQVCDALAYAHRRGIVHRDIKPSNLFLIEKKHAKVLDFGIARLPSSQLTQEGKILGTPNYMAPEQVLGKPTDGRSDLFSAAVVFFEFLVYSHPFQGESIPRRIVEDEPDALSASERKLPILLERVFARGLAKEPDRRYQTGDDFAADLRALSDLLLQNASPSFSRAPLPSERDVAARVGPPGEDLYDDRLTEMMQLMPEFEDAIAQGEAAVARQKFARLEAIATADPRFAEPVRLCRTRLAELDPSAGNAAPARPPEQAVPSVAASSAAPPTQDQGTNTKICGYCGAANRSAAAHCIKCGARLPAGTPAAPDPAPPQVAPQAQTQVRPSLEATALFQGSMPSPSVETRLPERGQGGEGGVVPNAPAVEPQQPAPPPERGVAPQERLRGWWQQLLELARKQKQVVWLAAGLLVAIVVMIAVAQRIQPIPVSPAVAFALVKPAHASLYADANAKSNAITVSNGEKIDVLQIPHAPDQPWVPVQLVREKGKKVFRPGYMRTADLEKWSSPATASEIRLMLLFKAGENGTDEQVQQAIYDLQHLVDHAPDAQESREAQVYMAGLELVLARSMKAAGRPDGDWQSHVESARKDLDAGIGGAEASVVEDYRNQIAALMEPVPAVSQTPAPGTPGGEPPVVHKKKPSIDDLLSKAEGLWKSDPNGAEKYVDQVLEMQPDNKRAQDLQEKIRRRKDALEKIQQQ
jgi:ribosomal protein L40E